MVVGILAMHCDFSHRLVISKNRIKTIGKTETIEIITGEKSRKISMSMMESDVHSYIVNKNNLQQATSTSISNPSTSEAAQAKIGTQRMKILVRRRCYRVIVRIASKRILQLTVETHTHESGTFKQQNGKAQTENIKKKEFKLEESSTMPVKFTNRSIHSDNNLNCV